MKTKLTRKQAIALKRFARDLKQYRAIIGEMPDGEARRVMKLVRVLRRAEKLAQDYPQLLN